MKTGNTQKKILGLVFGVALLSSGYAQAQFSSFSPTTSVGMIPALPPSEICAKWKILGTWKLLMVYESPPGRELERYVTEPLQYYVFMGDDRYGEYTGGLNALTPEEIRNFILNNQKTAHQFVVNSGSVFFYKDGVAVDSLACFMVAETLKPFTFGQMLLMPPQHSAASGRMVKVYQKVFP